MASTSAVGPGVSFGKPEPIELPTPIELEKDTEGLVSTIRRLSSPVFYSTGSSGAVMAGLGGIPEGRPLLFVGNHQLFAADMYPMVQEFVKQKGMLLRGLAHPIIFAGGNVLSDNSRDPLNGSRPNTEQASSFSSLLTTYGAVSVNARNMHKLLSLGEAVLLYPGGAREVGCAV